MKLMLNLEFESIAEMQDWIVAEASLLSRPAEPVMDSGWVVSNMREQIETRKENLKEDMKAAAEAGLEPAPVKKKRKRRTKAEMAAARAAEAAAKAETRTEETVDEAKQWAELQEGVKPEPTKGNGAGEQHKRNEQFRDLIGLNPRAANDALDEYIGKGKNFSAGTVEQQEQVLAALKG